MTFQTIEQAMSLLDLVQQPAFCLHHNGTVCSNPAAALLAPLSGKELHQWLGDCAETYEQWNRQNTLILAVSLGSRIVSVTVQPLENGALFLLSPTQDLPGSEQMTVTAQVLRQPLSELSGMAQQLTEVLEEMEDPFLQQQTAAMTRHIYRLNRIACNLADLELLHKGSYPARPEKLDLNQFLHPLLEELFDLCLSSGHHLQYELPEKSVIIHADPVLLERALYNLFSNAMKYGRKDVSIQFSADLNDHAVLFRVRNACTKENGDLLSAAFTRMTQRGSLPQPQWGIGLGIPLSLYIARAMGGTVAVDVSRDHFATVTMSISRKRSLLDTAVQTSPVYDYTGGMRRSLLELADALPNDCYDSTAI